MTDAKTRFRSAEKRPSAMTVDELKKPTFRRLPAVAAGRVTPWAMEERYKKA